MQSVYEITMPNLHDIWHLDCIIAAPNDLSDICAWTVNFIVYIASKKSFECVDMINVQSAYLLSRVQIKPALDAFINKLGSVMGLSLLLQNIICGTQNKCSSNLTYTNVCHDEYMYMYT